MSNAETTHDALSRKSPSAGRCVSWEGTVDEVCADVRGAERLLQALMEHVPDLIFFKDTASRFTCVNHAYAAYVGVDDPAALIGQTDADLFPPEQARAFLADEQRVVTTGEPLIGKPESRVGTDGQTRWVLTNKVPLRDPDGQISGLIGIARDITDRQEAEVRLRQSEARLGSLIHNALDIITILDADGTVRYESPAVERVLGYQPDELVGHNAFDFIHPDDRPPVHAAFRAALASPEHIPMEEFRFRHRDGSWRWLAATGTNLLADPAVSGFVVNSRDVTERKAFEERLWHQAHHDPLTGLPNRALFVQHLAQALERARRRRRRPNAVPVLFLDLDGFKVVNDSLGHECGDQLLAAVVERLVATLRAGDILARFGGDEFVVLLEHATNAAEAKRVAERLLAALGPPFPLKGQDVAVGASVGIVVNFPDHSNPSDLLRAADVALYRAKATDKGGVVVFDAARDESALVRLDRETALRHAIERGELRLHYQPKVELTTGRLIGVEALVRWQHPTGELLSPAAFMPLAEETGLIVPLGAWVLEEACRQAMAWHEQVPETGALEICVNVAPRQVRHPDVVTQIAAVLAETGLPPAHLTLEITEQGLVEDTEATDRTVQALKALGVQLAIDDFGAHQAGLSYLRRWPMDIVKLDRTLIAELERDTRSQAIVTAVVGLAHALGLGVTAEGIETAEQLARLRELGCDWGQGYAFAPPLPAEELVAFLREGMGLAT